MRSGVLWGVSLGVLCLEMNPDLCHTTEQVALAPQLYNALFVLNCVWGSRAFTLGTSDFISLFSFSIFLIFLTCQPHFLLENGGEDVDTISVLRMHKKIPPFSRNASGSCYLDSFKGWVEDETEATSLLRPWGIPGIRWNPMWGFCIAPGATGTPGLTATVPGLGWMRTSPGGLVAPPGPGPKLWNLWCKLEFWKNIQGLILLLHYTENTFTENKKLK